ncbi:MAG TPA: 30S ribosomal protein S2 [Candidatus Nitrosocosmicus sp.]|nr:30S ribosomal protein S2 [Candidatus Nitrosocosmicus sp.]HET6590384.1 30S ribosomal protein S2 [Candidatus Nitrosocosmicus sp.]
MEQCITNMNLDELNSANMSKDEIINDSSDSSNIDSESATSPDSEINATTASINDNDSTNAEGSGPDDEVDQKKDKMGSDDSLVNSTDSESDSIADDDDQNLEDPNNLEKMILSTGIRVGTPIKTKFMNSFITRANPEGLYILDISKTLARIDVAAKFIGRTNIANVAVTSAREYGKTPIEKFCELTGARGIFGRFMPGTFTNPSLPKYMEPEIVIVTDPQADEQAVLEATRAGVPVIALSNSDNITSKVDLVIPSNNRGRKALATVYWLLTKEVLKKQGKIKSDSDMPLAIDDFEAKLVEELI